MTAGLCTSWAGERGRLLFCLQLLLNTSAESSPQSRPAGERSDSEDTEFHRRRRRRRRNKAKGGGQEDFVCVNKTK